MISSSYLPFNATLLVYEICNWIQGDNTRKTAWRHQHWSFEGTRALYKANGSPGKTCSVLVFHTVTKRNLRGVGSVAGMRGQEGGIWRVACLRMERALFLTPGLISLFERDKKRFLLASYYVWVLDNVQLYLWNLPGHRLHPPSRPGRSLPEDTNRYTHVCLTILVRTFHSLLMLFYT